MRYANKSLPTLSSRHVGWMLEGNGTRLTVDLPPGAVPRMFADDTNLTLSAKTLTELKLALTPELNNLSNWLKANKLSLNVAKTELMIIGSRQRLSAQCDDVVIRIDDQIIKRVVHTKSLGLTIDAHLSWGKHVEEICKKVSSAIGALGGRLYPKKLQF